jgi:hypothetical protein
VRQSRLAATDTGRFKLPRTGFLAGRKAKKLNGTDEPDMRCTRMVHTPTPTKIEMIAQPIEPPEIQPPSPGNPTEPPSEDPPGSPQPDVIPPPIHEPGEPPPPDDLPGKAPDEIPRRGPNSPTTPNPAVS